MTPAHKQAMRVAALVMGILIAAAVLILIGAAFSYVDEVRLFVKVFQ